jgi:hypothetical protein
MEILLILTITGSNGAPAIDHIQGFSTYESCVDAGKAFMSMEGAHGVFDFECVVVGLDS